MKTIGFIFKLIKILVLKGNLDVKYVKPDPNPDKYIWEAVLYVDLGSDGSKEYVRLS